MACAYMTADSGCNDADRARARDQYVFTDQVKLQGAMGGISKRVKKRSQFRSNFIGDCPQIAGGHHDILGERTIAIDTDADGIGTGMRVSGTAIPTVAANDMTFGRHPVSFHVAGDAIAQLYDASDKFMTDYQAGLNGALRPVIPLVDMDIGAADCSFFDLDQYFIGAGYRYWNLFHPNTGAGFALHQRAHGLAHCSS